MTLWVCLFTFAFSLFGADSNRTQPQPLLLAFYHPWYGTPTGSAQQWYKWDSFRFPGRYQPARIKADGRHDIACGDYPLIGPYDQGDREIVRWHFRLAKAAGIDGFLCSWWKFRRGGSAWDKWQSDLFEKVLLPVAAEENFKLGVIDECAHYVPRFDDLLWRITNALPRLARHPAYLKIQGQPVWYVYQVWDDWLSAAEAGRYLESAEQAVGDVYWIFDKLKAVGTVDPPGARMIVRPEWLALPRIDCFGTYSYFGHWRDVRPASIQLLYQGFVKEVHQTGKAAQLPLSPGHDNTAVSQEPWATPRHEGALLAGFLKAIDDARPDIAIVCSWNEWLEMTQVEPSQNWTDPYLYLKQIARWRGRQWETPALPKAARP
jgi:hypothetical protein